MLSAGELQKMLEDNNMENKLRVLHEKVKMFTETKSIIGGGI